MGKMVQLNRNAKTFGILATGPVVKEEGMMPVRLVLRRDGTGNRYVTHKQEVCGREDHLHKSFSSGNYFPDFNFGTREALKLAVEDFNRRLMDQIAGLPDAATVTG